MINLFSRGLKHDDCPCGKIMEPSAKKALAELKKSIAHEGGIV